LNTISTHYADRNRHIKDAARRRYGIVLTDRDVANIMAQCRDGSRIVRTYTRDRTNGASEHHVVIVRDVRLLAVFKDDAVVTVLPSHWLPTANRALAEALQRARMRP
jgi:hypothetical protein